LERKSVPRSNTGQNPSLFQLLANPPDGRFIYAVMAEKYIEIPGLDLALQCRFGHLAITLAIGGLIHFLDTGLRCRCKLAQSYGRCHQPQSRAGTSTDLRYGNGTQALFEALFPSLRSQYTTELFPPQCTSDCAETIGGVSASKEVSINARES
jgi:hypothetical protein